ncbi:protein lethal(2)essential for life [Trichonephila inaurata madagascariensis]|uniref:Protein lethal(2)essential for life n=1 Tax=Trichonephila inaurata madagascariensis TaxID=2747483 RepID=A0A8X6XZ25_9ARAC|nr:protein lethal(2)essential for life [Trichonephila inaurata madagascariensis]
MFWNAAFRRRPVVSYSLPWVPDPSPHTNQHRNSGQSEVKNDDNQFQVSLNVKQFKPEEIEVKIVDNYIIIHGKHEEKNDEHGFVAREFTRKYMLPQNCQAETVTSSLSPDGVLSILAPKKTIEEPPKQERQVAIDVDESKKDGK